MAHAVKNTSKEDALQIIHRLPDDCTLEDILYHLHVRKKLEEAMKDIDAGRTFSQEEVERTTAEWLKSSGHKQL